MKYTLKNLIESLQEPSDEMDKLDVYVMWFEGFEKELREKMEKQPHGAHVYIKEILGE